MTEEDTNDFLGALMMLLPWIVLLVIAVIAIFTFPKKASFEVSTSQVDAITNILNTTEIYQFKWPSGIVESYSRENIESLVYHPETNSLEFTTSILEKDGWGSKNKTITVYGLENISIKSSTFTGKVGIY